MFRIPDINQSTIILRLRKVEFIKLVNLIEVFGFVKFEIKQWFSGYVAFVADETKPRYSPSANQRPKACFFPRVLPGFSIIGSNWLLHMAVLSCTVIGRVDLVEPWLRWRLRCRWIHDTQNKHDGDHGITWRGIIKCKSFTDMLFGVANAMVCLFSLSLWTFG